MFKGFLLVLLALVFVCGLVGAAVSAPENVRVKFVGYSSVKIAWAHEGGSGVSFNVYRGSSLEDAALRGTTSDLFYVDSGLLGGEEYVYFVTAVDSLGEEAWPLYSVTVKPTEKPEKPFELVLLYPDKETLALGSNLELIVGVNSPFFFELEGMEAELINRETGERSLFEFDRAKNIFFLTKRLPFEGEQANYTIIMRAVVAGESFSDSRDYSWQLAPGEAIDFWAIAANLFLVFGIPILALAIVGVVSFTGWKRSLKREKTKSLDWVELVRLLEERSVWKMEAMKKKIPQAEYEQRDREFQKKQDQLEAKLGGKPGSFEKSINPFAGFNEDEMNEVVTTVSQFGSMKGTMNREQALDWLLKQGKSEKVANKVADIIYGEKERDFS